ncbi:MAG TPA: DUF1697 domain-containing protein [Gemmatimonadaceae bacterium]|nr:DUF1697 domain-containing protein [Gemmatimonadaceae bacterium]
MSPSTRYVALLRAINVGGHVVKMDALRKHFTRLGFGNVETFIASGNVLFDAPDAKPRELEEHIGMELERALGYPVGTFVRSPTAMSSVVSHEPFAPGAFDFTQHALYIGFLAGKPTAATVKKVVALSTTMDELHIHGRELYWGSRGRFSDSTISGAALERALGMAMTMRNVTTVRKLAAKLTG